MKLYYVMITTKNDRIQGDWVTSVRRVGSQLILKQAGGETRVFPIEQVLEWRKRNVTPKEAADMAKITGQALEA